MKREIKKNISSDLIKKYLLNKLSFPLDGETNNIDNSLKKLNKLSIPDEIERGIKNVDFQINSYLKNKLL